MEYNSIAMIETNGLVSSITALNAMLKLENIKFLKKEVTASGKVTIFISGNAPHLEKVINAGRIVAENVGTVIATSIIENPTVEIFDIILENKKTSTRAKRSKKKDSETEKIDTLFDTVIETETSDRSLNEPANDTVLDKLDGLVDVEEHRVSEKRAEAEIESQPETKENIIHESTEIVVVSNNINETNESEVPQENVVDKNMDDSLLFGETEESKKLNYAPQDENNNKIAEVFEEQAVDKEITPEQEITKDELSPTSQIEKLRAEARYELENNDANSPKGEAPKNENKESADIYDEYSKMNVPQLRKLARSNPNFPIQGREISKANRKLLLSYFRQIS